MNIHTYVHTYVCMYIQGSYNGQRQSMPLQAVPRVRISVVNTYMNCHCDSCHGRQCVKWTHIVTDTRQCHPFISGHYVDHTGVRLGVVKVQVHNMQEPDIRFICCFQVEPVAVVTSSYLQSGKLVLNAQIIVGYLERRT